MAKAFVHPSAICETNALGDDTRIWAFAHVLPGATIGMQCNICDGVFVENDVVVGDRVTIKCGVQLWDGVRVEDDVFIGPNVTFTNDRFPRSKVYPEKFSETVLRRGASIGANATILPGIEIGQGAMIGAGAVVTRSVPANAVVFGNPARVNGYTNCADSVAAVGRGAAVFELPTFSDARGSLTVAEFAVHLPFAPARIFTVYNVPKHELRGEHAHKLCHQFMVCVSGSVKVLLDSGSARYVLTLDKPNVGVHFPPMIWGTQFAFSIDAVLTVFASRPYENADYIRSYREFRAAAHSQ